MHTSHSCRSTTVFKNRKIGLLGPEIERQRSGVSPDGFQRHTQKHPPPRRSRELTAFRLPGWLGGFAFVSEVWIGKRRSWVITRRPPPRILQSQRRAQRTDPVTFSIWRKNNLLIDADEVERRYCTVVLPSYPFTFYLPCSTVLY